MKTYFVEFEYMDKRNVRKNTAFIRIAPATKKSELQIQNIAFKSPVYDISYSQLTDLMREIQAVVDVESAPKGGELSLVKPHGFLDILKPGGIKRAIAAAEQMNTIASGNGSMSEQEKKDANAALQLIKKFLE